MAHALTCCKSVGIQRATVDQGIDWIYWSFVLVAWGKEILCLFIVTVKFWLIALSLLKSEVQEGALRSKVSIFEFGCFKAACFSMAQETLRICHSAWLAFSCFGFRRNPTLRPLGHFSAFSIISSQYVIIHWLLLWDLRLDLSLLRLGFTSTCVLTVLNLPQAPSWSTRNCSNQPSRIESIGPSLLFLSLSPLFVKLDLMKSFNVFHWCPTPEAFERCQTRLFKRQWVPVLGCAILVQMRKRRAELPVLSWDAACCWCSRYFWPRVVKDDRWCSVFFSF